MIDSSEAIQQEIESPLGSYGDPGVEYRPIPSCPNCYAGSDGSIWKKGKFLMPHAPGFFRVQGTQKKKNLNGETINRTIVVHVSYESLGVHNLVLEAFVGPRPRHHVAWHIDGDRSNNKVTNLVWKDYGKENDGMRPSAALSMLRANGGHSGSDDDPVPEPSDSEINEIEQRIRKEREKKMSLMRGQRLLTFRCPRVYRCKIGSSFGD